VRQEVEKHFREYIFGFMFGDLRREIALARSGRGGGNFLAALGLLCYTEALGRMQNHLNGRSIEGSAENFEVFFDRLGAVNGHAPYRSWRLEWESRRQARAYDVLRCGMAHEYLPKLPAVAEIGSERPMGVYEDVFDDQERLVLNVDAYFRDFSSACAALFAEFMSDDSATLPETKVRKPKAP
jgi:hypothetical protein